MTDPPSLLPIVRLNLQARTQAPLDFPPYAGSMLRGAFGHALEALAPLPHRDSTPCILQDACPYCQLFCAPPLPGHPLQKFSQMPHPYVIEPPPGGTRLPAGKDFQFSVVLIGKALAHLRVIILAFKRALQTGLGPERAPCTLLCATQDETGLIAWQVGTQHAIIHPDALTVPPSTDIPIVGDATLRLLSPLRLQTHGKPADAAQLTARNLLIALARRYQLLLDIHVGANAPQQDFTRLQEDANDIELATEDLSWLDWGRYSQRQQREMKLGGLSGCLHLRGKLTPFADLLYLGQWLHIGKNTSFGLGQYRLESTHLSPQPPI